MRLTFAATVAPTSRGVRASDHFVDEGDLDVEARPGFPQESPETLNNGSCTLVHRDERGADHRDQSDVERPNHQEKHKSWISHARS